MLDNPRLRREGPSPKTGIVHLGPGAFFRAFNAIFTDEAMAEHGGDWGITAISLRSPTAREQLAPQGGAYTSVELGAEGKTTRVIGAITGVRVAPENPAGVVAFMSDPAIRIVSLTITEKGYCHNPATGQLNTEHPDIAHDIAALDAPKSAIGFIVSALKTRRDAGIEPFTVLSCDNLPSNGAVTRSVVIDFARLIDADLASWIESSVSFPSTMVDRITPATTDLDIAQLLETDGYTDPACVVHEPFRQWVIEDSFTMGRPSWESVGAQIVQSVEAHELMKLRCLNGTHSTLAYLGYLAGYETIAETVADPAYARLCQHLWANEILPTVPQPEGEDLPAYCAALLERYRNPAIRHRTWQIAMDGSQKLPQRILGTIADNLAEGRVPTGLCLAVAGWMRYVGAVDDAGNEIDVRDPLAARLKAASDSADTPAGKVAALLTVEDVFDPELAKDARFQEAVIAAYETIAKNGAKFAVEGLIV